MTVRVLARPVIAWAGAAVLMTATAGYAQAPAGVTSDGTPVPRTADGRADLSGVWNKRLVVNTATSVEPLPFTPAGLQAFNDVWNHVDPTSRCILPGRAPREHVALSDADRPAARQSHLPLRVHAQLPGDLHRRPHAPADLGAVAARRLDRPLGWRHARHRHRQPHRPHLARRSRQPPQRRAARHRALAPHQRQPVGVRGDDRRPEVLHEAVDGELDHRRWHQRTGC